MRIAGIVFFGSSSLAGWAYTLFAPATPHAWIGAPLLATTIILTMGCLILLGTGRPTPRSRSR